MVTRRSFRRFAARPARWLRRMGVRRAEARRLKRRRTVESAVYKETDGRVAGGPFKGMKFVEHAVWGSAAPFLAGTYEAEIQPAIEALIESRADRVIDVGAAEGYYAVGLALRLANSTVYAFDIDHNARSACAEVAERNRVAKRVIVRGECTHSDLVRLSGPGCAMVVDCEGFERELLDPVLVPNLASTLILVELHDFIDATISGVIHHRFASTHDIQRFGATQRNPASAPAIWGLPFEIQQEAVDEMRPTTPGPMEWMFMTPRPGNPSSTS
jgi:hypothetical protein